MVSGQWSAANGPRPLVNGHFSLGRHKKARQSLTGSAFPGRAWERVGSGLTLFEVIIALAIFLIAVEAVSELLTLSTNNAVRAPCKRRARSCASRKWPRSSPASRT